MCFNKVADIVKKPGGLPFWHVGRTLNTCHDYIIQNGANVPFDLKRYEEEVLPSCQAFFLDQAGGADSQKWWWDDYGWWGLAQLATGNLANAKDCWVRMNTYGVDKASSSADYLGGCWNHTIEQDPPGCENSVTNATFFLLSLRLLKNSSFTSDPTRKLVLAAAANWMRWFNHWLGRPGAIRNPLRLIRERPVGDKDDHFAGGQPTSEVGWIWTGDQGLTMAWLAEALGLAPADWQAIFQGGLSRAGIFQIATDIRNGMAPLFDGDGVLHEAPYSANSLGPYNIDYCSGRGVFMRYLAFADASFRNDPSWNSSSARILSTADAVIARLGELEPTLYSWSYAGEKGVLQTWKDKVTGPAEGDPCLCNDAVLSPDATPELVFYGIALDALTAATAVRP